MLRFLLLVSATVLALAGPASARGPHPGASGRFHRSVCGPAPARAAHCLADVVTNAKGTPLASPAALPPGYGPADLQNAYNLASAVSAGGGAGKTVAIVDAHHDPNAEADLGVYRQTYGLPACTSASGCFRQVNQNGSSTSPPATDAGWTQEISLDLDMVSAVCPGCSILLVEANSSYLTDLGTAVNTAASLGASAISNSYGGSEYSSETSDESAYYNHPGINVTVSSGDNGYGVEFPAASRYVTAVGGTSLGKASNTRGWSETAWSGAGSGCSSYVPQPAWQTVPPGCTMRTVADVSSVADPNTGVAVYDSLPYLGQSGWMVFGGTSVASPVVASVDALSSPARALGYSYANSSQFFDVVGGSNGSCSTTYLCAAVNGYDGPTGMGTPNGAGAGAVAPPTAPPSNTAPPGITGSAVQGQTLTASTGVWKNSPASYSYQWQSCASSCVPVGSNASTYRVQASDVGNTIDVIVTATNGVGSSSATSASTPRVAAGQADFTISAPAAASVRRYTSTQLSVTVNPVNGFASPTTMSVSGLPSGVSPSWSRNPATPGSATLLTLTASRARTGTFTVTIKGAAGTLTHTTTTRLTVTR